MRYLTLRFHLFGIPIEVQPTFWLIALLLGMSGTAQTVLIWMVAVFIGVLVHELGHALVARSFGGKPDITLYMMGGLTRPNLSEGQTWTRFQSAMVTIAGPAAGFLLGLVAFAWLRVSMPEPGTREAQFTFIMLWINWGWGVLNLIPVLPLDGGNLMRAVLSGTNPVKGLWRATWVSAIVAPIVALAAYRVNMRWAALLFALFAYNAIKSLISFRAEQQDHNANLFDKLKQAFEAFDDGDIKKAEQLAKEVAGQAKVRVLRVYAIQLRVRVLMVAGRPREALEVLQTMSPDDIPPRLMGECKLALDELEEAIEYLQLAARDPDDEEAAQLLEIAIKLAEEREKRTD